MGHIVNDWLEIRSGSIIFTEFFNGEEYENIEVSKKMMRKLILFFKRHPEFLKET